jgi:hypothetical protein
MQLPGASAENVQQDKARFIKLDNRGRPLADQGAAYEHSPWACVLDRRTGLLWEVKARNGLRSHRHSYSWYEPRSGGSPGYPDRGRCNGSDCDTQAYAAAVNRLKLCGSDRWRLPHREELRGIVDYRVPAPGPSIDRVYFPNTVSQFYWSATQDANDQDSAWGIGFTFGYDYGYFKSDFGHVRLVSETPR